MSDTRGRVLYFLYNRYTGLIKVGISNDFLSRLNSLECACGVRLDTLGTLPDGNDLESALHEALFETREVGEWFRPSEELLAIARQPCREAVQALIAAKAPIVREHKRAVEEATREAWEAAQARKLEAKRIAREKAKREAEKKAAKERAVAERKRRAIEREAVERHTAMEAFRKGSKELLAANNLVTSEPVAVVNLGQRVRNKQFVGLEGSAR